MMRDGSGAPGFPARPYDRPGQNARRSTIRTNCLPSYLPGPFSVEDCGLLVALSVTVNVPSLVPVAVGLNTTLVVHLAFAARVVVHVVEDSLKSPVIAITMLLIAKLRLLVSVNTFATLVVPTVCDANVALVGVNATGGAPVPERATV